MSKQVKWQPTHVISPHLKDAMPVIAAKNIPYVPNANRLQNFSIYVPNTPETLQLDPLLLAAMIHGGAWRDPFLTSASIEADVAHAFSEKDPPIDTVISINYTLSPFPTHPSLPYDPTKDKHTDPAREAIHLIHIRDILAAFELLRSFGLTDDSYVISGHSCGACLAFQAVLRPPGHWGLELSAPPRPAALLGMNGLYHLPALVHGLGSSHQHLRDVYEDLQGIAFGMDQSKWPAASPALFDPKEIARLVSDGKAPRLAVVDQSTEDQLVPANQADRMEAGLKQVAGLRVVRGNRCDGPHAAPWEQGYMIWENIKDIVKLLGEQA